MILAAGLLVLLGLGLFVAGVATGATVLYWATVASCALAALLLLVARRGLTPEPGEKRPPVIPEDRTAGPRTSHRAGNGRTGAAGPSDDPGTAGGGQRVEPPPTGPGREVRGSASPAAPEPERSWPPAAEPERSWPPAAEPERSWPPAAEPERSLPPTAGAGPSWRDAAPTGPQEIVHRPGIGPATGPGAGPPPAGIPGPTTGATGDPAGPAEHPTGGWAAPAGRWQRPAGEAEPATGAVPAAPPPSPAVSSGGGAHAAAEPPVEEVEVTDLLLVVDLTDEVLVVDEHPRYHLAGCSRLHGETAIPLPLDEARTDGFTPCGSCAPDRHLADRERARRAGRRTT